MTDTGTGADTQRIYEQRGFLLRMRLSTGVLVLAFLYGLWETYGALTGPDTNNGLIFGVLFIAASFYGGFQLMKDFGDSVATLDRDGDTLTATLWRPWGTLKIAGPRERFTNWRFHIVMAKRNQRMPVIRVDHPDYPRPLAMELKPGVTPLDGLRDVAPDAVADYEEAIRVKTT